MHRSVQLFSEDKPCRRVNGSTQPVLIWAGGTRYPPHTVHIIPLAGMRFAIVKPVPDLALFLEI